MAEGQIDFLPEGFLELEQSLNVFLIATLMSVNVFQIIHCIG
jgi:hypothetical protein